MDKDNVRKEIIQLLQSTGREGIGSLIEYMLNQMFFESPCSAQYHLCKPGGLAEHSLNVYETMKSFYESTSWKVIEKINPNSITLVSLLHDLGKAGQFGKLGYVENLISDKKGGFIQSEKKPYETNKDLLPVPHEIRSIQIISQFIKLTEEESFAILHHNGMYGDLKYQLSGKETPIQMLLHFADMWASRVVEV